MSGRSQGSSQGRSQGRSQSQHNNRGRGGRRNKSAPLDPRDAHRRASALKYANQLSAQGLYVWAGHWRKYAKSPPGTAKPPNYHRDPTDFGIYGAQDPRLSVYQGTIESERGLVEYHKWLSKVKPNQYQGCESIGSGYGGTIVQNRQMSMRELGEIKDEKGYPFKLIALSREMMKKYPQFYRKSSGIV